MDTGRISEMLEINKRQKIYYEKATGYGTSKENNAPTNLYRLIKVRAFSALSSTSKDQDVIALHRSWAGDLSDSRVLDLGCGSGNPLSVEFAKSAKQYLAVDLSESRCEALRVKLNEAGVGPSAKVEAGDFLSPDFHPGQQFDLIYALSVFHHFRHFDDFLAVVQQKLAPGGKVIIYDPLVTWWPMRVLRTVLRPWQTDADWEYPFDNASIALLRKRFRISESRGLVGRSKWAAIAGVVSPSLGQKLAQKWHRADLDHNKSIEHSRGCLHFTAKLEHH